MGPNWYQTVNKACYIIPKVRKFYLDTSKRIKEIEGKDRLDKLRLLFSQGSLKLLNIIGKFIKRHSKKLENGDNANAS